MEKEVNTQWHPAFCSALKLELREDAKYLSYTNEYNINTKPLQMDMLIIKKPKDVEIKNTIGKIFRGHNVVEYKSPRDSLNLDCFLKVIAYAYLYKSSEAHIDEIDFEDISITLVRKGIPRKLMSWLKKQGYEVDQKYKGIFYISRERDIPVQVIVSRLLSKNEQKWLTLLTEDLTEEDVKRAVLQTNALMQKEEKDYADSVLQVVLKTNKKSKLVKEDEGMCQALRELMAEEIEEELEKARTEAKKEAMELTMFQLVRKNIISVETAAGELHLSEEEFVKKMNAHVEE